MINLDLEKLPRHIAIIMDGNGRWAQRHTLGRISGHKKGAEAVRVAVRTCREIGIQYLTLYAFSVENWIRPPEEVNALMDLLEEYLRSETTEMIKNNIRLATIGNVDALRDSIKNLLLDIMEKTAKNNRLILNLALSYGGRDEIVEAVRKIIGDCRTNKITPAELTKDSFSSYLYTAHMPDPDLLIRTSGEYRLSNFLLWQMAYTEFYFTDILWPDFKKEDLLKAIADYQQRERRYGLTSDQLHRDYNK
ncbi:MAG: isoprenyl transferase [Deltaproteobacteria bacterium]|nr:isoprenyl transferase [Deltaproteobacteria bacterium]